MPLLKNIKSHFRNYFVKYKIWLISLAHSFVLLSLGYIWLGMTYTFGDEAFLIKWTALIKKDILNFDPKPLPSEVLFINTSQSKVEIEINRDPLAIQPEEVEITDRKQLSELVSLIEPYKDDVQLVVLDLIFDLPSEDDSLLQTQLNKMRNKILGAVHINKNKEIPESVLDLPVALATYRSAEGMFFKYPIVYNEQKTLPAIMYEKISGNTISKKGMFFRDGNKISLKAPITDFKVRMTDFKLGKNLDESNFALHHMGTITELGKFMEPKDLKKMFAGKIIMIGDFDNDTHKTAFGIMPGMLIVFNAYLTLLNNDNIITLGWLLLIVIGFTWISHRILTGKGFNLLDLLKNKFRSGWIHFIIDSLDELFFLSILTILSYLFFNIHINILVLFVYLKLVEFGIDIVKNRYKIEV
ncbi:CHASE2 domain-containing protein [Maribellus maritimus]|uniref:CHASE2 domain-containing protein n=1 Tax=Maribellus maritimus TaxID=2870838 RepID=UPI001EECA34B|nr:CHASE2 domain-containing protein [Maribellus maritimus]MCG6186785.1 CHASE2 domain-containing protein [Maribellus maritimus]